MGWIAHDAVIVTAPSDHYLHGESPRAVAVEEFRASLPEEWRPLVIGPVRHPVNGDVTYAFLPDGSKEGWEMSDEGDQYREQFLGLFSFTFPEGSSPYDIVHVRFGRDHGIGYGATIEYANDRHGRSI